MQTRLSEALGPGASPGRPPIWTLEEACRPDADHTRIAHPVRRPDDPIYCMYTSGSTGRPKGVVIPHRGVSRLIVGQDFCSLSAAEVVLHAAPLSFDGSTFEIWSALLHGGAIAIVGAERPSLDDIAKTIREFNVSTAWLTAGLFHLMVDCRIDALAGLRQLLAGGDALSPAHVRKFLHAAPHCRLINGYGPTENTTFTTCATLSAGPWPCSSAPIGRAIAGTQVFVVDEALKPVIPGAEGQLVTAGAGLAVGYLNRPDLTAEKFVTAPEPISQRIYLTGDRARLLPDGEIEFLGRSDRQVKIDGKRIEPGEIEQALRGCTGIADASVIVEPTPAGVKQLLAFVAVGSRSHPKMVELARSAHASLRSALPEYLWPSRVVPVAVLPITPNGKVDRAALLALLRAAVSPLDGGSPHSLESRIADIWKAVLGRDQIGLDEVFFDLGGRSLQLMQVHSALQDLAGVRIEIAAMFSRPTIRMLAEYVRQLQHGGAPEDSGQDADLLSRADLKRAAIARRQRNACARSSTHA